MIPPYRKFENLHILLWLIKDFFWVTDQKIAGVIMIVPTVGVALYIVYRSRHVLGDVLHNLAVVMWISANSVWMIGEFYFVDGTRPYAIVFFIAGLASVGYHYLISEPFWRKPLNEEGFKG